MTRIGISPRLLHPQPGARGVFTKVLHYVEDGIAKWLLSRDALLFVLPLSERASDYAKALDGLVLQGGADISPLAYGEQPLK
ncbi:MAG: gamma-glutamyl-gamma-aminobutyrate hydrolase family protein, partial [Betaproteobacteria bacterium]|nr:gamma-glutamyl-gamma-aminobutyrate hydrolase family protein [Betaproteobacteria bacterium]